MSHFHDGKRDSLQITSDGVINLIYNGITDWLYEEEIMATNNAMYWSPRSRFLAYIRFDDSNVNIFSVPLFEKSPYMKTNDIRYPNVGSPNPTAQVLVYDTEKSETLRPLVPESVKQGFGEFYIWSVKFFSESEIIVVLIIYFYILKWVLVYLTLNILRLTI